MAQQRETAPSGIAGLVRYEEEKSKVNIRPEYVFAGIAAIAEIELLSQGLFFIAVTFGILFGLLFYWLYGKTVFPEHHPAKPVSVQPQASQTAQPAQQPQEVQQAQRDIAQQ